MSKKITKEEFLSRFYQSYPDEQIEIVEYSAITRPAKVKCLKCGKIQEKKSANKFLCDYKCCGENKNTKYEKIVQILSNNNEYEIVKKVNGVEVIIKHNICGNEFKRSIQSVLLSPNACPHCNTLKKKNMISIQEVQERLDEKFIDKNIKILEYNGQLEKNYYKCLKCGLIFTTDQTSIMASRGCPKCDRQQSNGERKMKDILGKKNIIYKQQVGVSELPLQKFDFGVYDEQDKLLYYIEVNGEQHYEEREIFRDGLGKIQERDNKKREYCKKNNIPLYEVKWFKGEFKNLDILPF